MQQIVLGPPCSCPAPNLVGLLASLSLYSSRDTLPCLDNDAIRGVLKQCLLCSACRAITTIRRAEYKVLPGRADII